MSFVVLVLQKEYFDLFCFHFEKKNNITIDVLLSKATILLSIPNHKLIASLFSFIHIYECIILNHLGTTCN